MISCFIELHFDVPDQEAACNFVFENYTQI